MGHMSASPRPADDRRFSDPRSAKLAELLEPVVARRGLFLEELELKPAGARTALRVVVDYAEGSEQVDLDTLAELSEEVSALLDGEAETTLGDVAEYDLEVSTPGATRPLTQPRHFRRNVGRLLEVTTSEDRSFVARLEGVSEQSITVSEQKPAPKKGMPVKYRDPVELSLTSITRARVQVEFSHTEDD